MKFFFKSLTKSSLLFSLSSTISLKRVKPSASITVLTSDKSTTFLTKDLLLLLNPRPGPITIAAAHSFTAFSNLSAVTLLIALSVLSSYVVSIASGSRFCRDCLFASGTKSLTSPPPVLYAARAERKDAPHISSEPAIISILPKSPLLLYSLLSGI